MSHGEMFWGMCSQSNGSIHLGWTRTHSQRHCKGVVIIMGCQWLEYYGLSKRGREDCLHDNEVAKGLGLKEKVQGDPALPKTTRPPAPFCWTPPLHSPPPPPRDLSSSRTNKTKQGSANGDISL
ncbi:hypothetical protein DPEC_G00144170 [Dallia pectoralis]|uniref:Uncharacterized protein n=1 Tax=Dallia pectoralis TaxID=75939 RepID=A0ACC2GNI2_DALPE|nr:hypothetical protein DPEC_G00144170 [Dallia pectoralis]